MKRVVFAALVFAVAACGAEPPAAERPSAAATATTEPVPSTRNIITEGVHDKRVGQPGGFGCADGPDAVCDVTFTVTAIEQDPPCAGATVPAGKRLLRFEVDAQASQAFQYTPPATALLLDNWAVETDDGALHQGLQMVEDCSPDPGVFIRPIAAGSHPRDSVVVIAPSRVTWLWLQYEKTPYRWPVRPPV